MVQASRDAGRSTPCRSWASGSGSPGRATTPSSSRSPSVDRPAATPASSTPTAGLVEVAYYADDGVVLHEAAHGWFNGSLLADRWSNEAFASYYGEAAAKALKVKATANELTAAAAEVGHPAQRLGPGRARDRGGRGLRLRRFACARPGDRRAGRPGRAARRLEGRRRTASARTSRRSPPLRPRGPASPSRSTARPIGACSWTCSKLGRLPPTTICGGRGSPETRTCRCSIDAGHRPGGVRRGGGRGGRLGTAAAHPGRDARMAVRRGHAPCSRTRPPCWTGARRSRSAAAAAGLVVPTTLRDDFQGTDGFDDAHRRGRRRNRRHRALLDRGRDPPGRARPHHPDRVVGLHPGGGPCRGSDRLRGRATWTGPPAPPIRPSRSGPPPTRSARAGS